MEFDRNALKVVLNEEAQRFEIELGEHLAVLDYHLRDKTMSFIQTGVPRELEGNGIGSLIVHAGLDYARVEGYGVIPICSFVVAYIQRHSEYRELVS